MSDPKRYLAKMSWTQIETQEHPNGEFVLWQDYAKLKAEVERLTAVVNYRKDMDTHIKIMADQYTPAKEGKQS